MEKYITHNQGDNWQDISYIKNSKISLTNVYFFNKDSGWVFGYDNSSGFQLVTNDGGAHWQRIYADPVINKKRFLNKKVSYGYEYSPTLLFKTFDGGYTWFPITIPFIAPWIGTIESFFFINEEIGYISGGIAQSNYLYGIIYKTTDGGNTWKTNYKSEISSRIFKLFFLDEDYGWAISTEGLLKTKNGGSTIVKEIQLKSVDIKSTLMDNYPNPFNPITTIEYNLKKSGIIKLIVYDVLGRQIDIIVNGYENAGHHKAIFNGAKLSSGIYYYYMITDDSFQSKTMVLLK